MARKYYWLKLQHNFFNEKRIKKLRKIAGGDTYTIIYLKMQLLSLQDEGKLYFDNVERTFEEEVALELDEDIEDVKVTIMYLLNCGLLEKVDDEYTLIEAKNNMGSETFNAEKMRQLREKRKESVTMLQDVTKCYIDIDKEKDIDKDIDKEKNNKYIVEIIEHLNLRTGQNYKTTTKKTKDLIKARFNEKFTVDDFKTVIDKMCVEWMNTDMQKYLRPETLFGPKFESYLNREVRVTTKNISLTEEKINELFG